MWQALETQKLLELQGFKTEIISIVSEGDLKLKQPIYEIGITGVFTKALDIALINNEIDLAVHSLKDVPTQLPHGLHLTACLPRGDHKDILVFKDKSILQKEKRIIATGSLRRKAFWLSEFPQDEVVDLRGNVQLRIQKLLDNAWDAAIFAAAGLERSEIISELHDKGLQYMYLENMISAPSQGIVGVVTRKDLDLSVISNENAAKAASIERSFLRKLQGGCTAPIGGYAEISHEGKVHFEAAVLNLDGSKKIEITHTGFVEDPIAYGIEMAEKCIAQGADRLILEVKKSLQ